MEKKFIVIQGAKEHNLKNINVQIPRDRLTVVTGLSGSGKSSLAFDTIYAEGQRRYVESLSSYARQFLDILHKPNVDHIDGLSPAISIEQRKAGLNPRSTVGTQTEIYDHLRLLFSRIGVAHCPKCGKKISTQTAQEITESVMAMGEGVNPPAVTQGGRAPRPLDQEGTTIMILAPIIKGRKGEYQELFRELRKDGFSRARVDGNIVGLDDEAMKLEKYKAHTILAVIDRIKVSAANKKRITDSVETALHTGKGTVIVTVASDKGDKDHLFSEHNACLDCGLNFEKLEPRAFSFNSPYGACPACDGLGNKMEIDTDLVVPDKAAPLLTAIEPWRRGGKGLWMYFRRMLRSFAREQGIDVETPYNKISKEVKKLLLYGPCQKHGGESGLRGWGVFEGVVPNLERRFRETESEFIKNEINKYMSIQPCPGCRGKRLKPEILAVNINGKNIYDITTLSVKDAKEFFAKIKLNDSEKKISEQVTKEINSRLAFMSNVGLDYLTLDRRSNTLSGGEAQRIRLATQIGAGLVGVLYVLDEPSIGLHQKDNAKLLDTLTALRDLGNTLVVVEHDEATIRMADYVIDLGPGAGEHGGEVIVQGTIGDVLKSKESLTGKYLRGELVIPVPKQRRSFKSARKLAVKGASEHNLKGIDVEIPLGSFVCVTGVSGSGKSTLVDEILFRALAKKLYKAKEKPGAYREISGIEHLDKVIVIDQSPIGRTPRSNPATYTGAFSFIRDIYSKLPESKLRGYKPGRFSFNVKGGRCESCQGDGIKKIEMHFLPDVYVECEICKGRRFNEQTLQALYKGKSISDVLDMSVEEAHRIFENIPGIRQKMKTLIDVGLGYVKVGQSATTLSGGEAQRIKLAAELSRRATGRTIYILDEPTTGLHFADVAKLITVLSELVAGGNTVLVIEHNLDVIKQADHIIDLGPDGGDQGGMIMAQGTPEEVAGTAGSYTGRFLKQVLRA